MRETGLGLGGSVTRSWRERSGSRKKDEWKSEVAKTQPHATWEEISPLLNA